MCQTERIRSLPCAISSLRLHRHKQEQHFYIYVFSCVFVCVCLCEYSMCGWRCAQKNTTVTVMHCMHIHDDVNAGIVDI